MDRRRESGKVVLSQSYEGLGGLEALTLDGRKGNGLEGRVRCSSLGALGPPWPVSG